MDQFLLCKQMTQNYYKSPLKVHGLKAWVKKPPYIFQNVKTVQYQGSLFQFYQGHQKFIFNKIFVQSGLTFTDNFFFHDRNVSLLAAQLYHVFT